MNELAKQLNEVIENGNVKTFEMLSAIGKQLFFPKGILSQSAEAKQKAHKLNATIGIAKEGSSVLSLSSVTQFVTGIEPDSYLPYAPSYGIPALRERWKTDLYKKNPSLAGKDISLYNRFEQSLRMGNISQS